MVLKMQELICQQFYTTKKICESLKMILLSKSNHIGKDLTMIIMTIILET